MRRPLSWVVLLLAACSQNSPADCPGGSRLVEQACRIQCTTADQCLRDEACEPTLGVCVPKSATDAGLAADAASAPDAESPPDAEELRDSSTWPLDAEALDTGANADAEARDALQDAGANADAAARDALSDAGTNADAQATDAPWIEPDASSGGADAALGDRGNTYEVAFVVGSSVQLREIGDGINTLQRELRGGVAGAPPAWSRDGSFLAHEGGNAIYVTQLSGPSAGAQSFVGEEPDWSRVTEEIAFADRTRHCLGIFNLTTGLSCVGSKQVSRPRWSSAGQIAYLVQASVLGDWNLEIATPPGRAEPLLIAQHVLDFDWAPSGSHLAWVTQPFSGFSGELLVCASSGASQPEVVVNGIQTARPFVAWSPILDLIALAVTGDESKLYVVPAAVRGVQLSSIQPVLTTPGPILGLEWTADAGALAFSFGPRSSPEAALTVLELGGSSFTVQTSGFEGLFRLRPRP